MAKMNREQAEQRVLWVVAWASTKKRTVAEAITYAEALGLTLTPAFIDPVNLTVHRGFLYTDHNGLVKRVEGKLSGLDEPAVELFDTTESDSDRIRRETEAAYTVRGPERRASVDHPHHYNMGGPKGPDGTAQYEAIKVIEDWSLGFKLGNALKYVLRAPHKGDAEKDLDKARWYLNRYVLIPDPGYSSRPDTMAPDDVSSAWNLDEHLTLAVRGIWNSDARTAFLAVDRHIVSRRA